MIEKKIDLLTKAIEELTKAINKTKPEKNTNTSASDTTKSKATSKTSDTPISQIPKADLPPVENNPANTEHTIITHDGVRELAKEVIAKGTPRLQIKQKITDLGAESISDLNDESLEKFYKFLKSL